MLASIAQMPQNSPAMQRGALSGQVRATLRFRDAQSPPLQLVGNLRHHVPPLRFRCQNQRPVAGGTLSYYLVHGTLTSSAPNVMTMQSAAISVVF
jgi:hypothetical protein